MDKAMPEVAPVGHLEWRYRTIWDRSKSSRIPLSTQYQAIGSDKKLTCWLESVKLLVRILHLTVSLGFSWRNNDDIEASQIKTI